MTLTLFVFLSHTIPFSCVAGIDCGDPVTIPGLVAPTGTTFYGDSFRFVCQAPSVISGSSGNTDGVTVFPAEVPPRVRCRNDGKWDYGNLTCTGTGDDSSRIWGGPSWASKKSPVCSPVSCHKAQFVNIQG